MSRRVWFIEFRHCAFKARWNQRSKWNGWVRYSVDFARKRDAVSSMRKCQLGISDRHMEDFKEVRVVPRDLSRGQRLAR